MSAKVKLTTNDECICSISMDRRRCRVCCVLTMMMIVEIMMIVMVTHNHDASLVICDLFSFFYVHFSSA